MWGFREDPYFLGVLSTFCNCRVFWGSLFCVQSPCGISVLVWGLFLSFCILPFYSLSPEPPVYLTMVLQLCEAAQDQENFVLRDGANSASCQGKLIQRLAFVEFSMLIRQSDWPSYWWVLVDIT